MAFPTNAYQSGCDDLSGYAFITNDSGESGNNGLLVCYRLGDRLSKRGNSLGSSVKCKEDIASDSLAGSKLVRNFTSTELGLVSGTLDIALVQVVKDSTVKVVNITAVTSTR
jgi:hypothetical protein